MYMVHSSFVHWIFSVDSQRNIQRKKERRSIHIAMYRPIFTFTTYIFLALNILATTAQDLSELPACAVNILPFLFLCLG